MNHEFKNKIKRRLYESLLSEENYDGGNQSISPAINPYTDKPFWRYFDKPTWQAEPDEAGGPSRPPWHPEGKPWGPNQGPGLDNGFLHDWYVLYVQQYFREHRVYPDWWDVDNDEPYGGWPWERDPRERWKGNKNIA